MRVFDLALLLPFMRYLRIFAFLERVTNAKFFSFEPIRAVISQWIVTILATEIFGILTIRAIDSLQDIVQSPLLPEKIRGLCSYNSLDNSRNSEISEFFRISIPLLLNKVAPSMRMQLIDLFEHALQKSIMPALNPNLKIDRQYLKVIFLSS